MCIVLSLIGISNRTRHFVLNAWLFNGTGTIALSSEAKK